MNDITTYIFYYMRWTHVTLVVCGEAVFRGIRNNGIAELRNKWISVSSILTTKSHSIPALEVEYVVCVR